jgi:hypothetical protein
MFMIATIQISVAGPEAQPGSSWLPRPGNVNRSTLTPKPIATPAAAT